MIETEIKFLTEDAQDMLAIIADALTFDRLMFVRDVIYGYDDAPKIRVRYVVNPAGAREITAEYKGRISVDNGVVTEQEDVIYQGTSDTKLLALLEEKGYVPESAYEKVRMTYIATEDVEVVFDLYPYAAIVEIEGEIESIWKVADLLGFRQEHVVTENADEVYELFCERLGIRPMYDVRFGLIETVSRQKDAEGRYINKGIKR